MRRTELITHLRTSESVEYSVEHMTAAVAAKTLSRQSKGLDFSCLVLQGKDPLVYKTTEVAVHGGAGGAAGGAGAGPGAAVGAASRISDPTSSTEEQLEELKCLLNYLAAAQSTLTSGTRYQVLYKSIAQHWFTIDIALQHGKFSIFLIDTVSHDAALEALVVIAQLLPDATLYYCGIVIQKDGYNCASFAFDHASCLARVSNLHQLLAKNFICNASTSFVSEERELKLKDFDPVLSRVHCIEASDFTDELAPLLRNTQNIWLIKKNSKLGLLKAGYSDKADNLRWKTESETDLIISKTTGAPTLFSKAITKVRAKITHRTLEYLMGISDEEFELLISKRTKTALTWATYSEKAKPYSRTLMLFKPLASEPSSEATVEDEKSVTKAPATALSLAGTP